MRRDVRAQVDVTGMGTFIKIDDAKRMAGMRIAPVDSIAIDRHIGETGVGHDQQFMHRALKPVENLLNLVGRWIDKQDFGSHFIDPDHSVSIAHVELSCASAAHQLARSAQGFIVARMKPSPDTSIVLFSGGQDSTVCLAWALQRFNRVETVGFDYGQRHAVELEGRERLREGLASLNADWRNRLAEDHVIKLDALAAVSE